MEVEDENHNKENNKTEKKETNIKMETEEINIKTRKEEIKAQIKREEINKEGIKTEIEKIIIKEKELIPIKKDEIAKLVKLTEKIEEKENKEENKEKIDEIEQKIEKLKEEEIKNIKLIPKQELTISVIHNITPNVTEGHLKEIFSNYGEVKEVYIPINKETLLKKNYAFIEFVKKENAEQAQLYMDGGQIDGRVVRVEIISQKNHIELK